MRALSITMPVGQALKDPAISLRMGARYFAEQIKVFDGNTIAALAAYKPVAATRGGGLTRRRQETPTAIDGRLTSVRRSDTSATFSWITRGTGTSMREPR